MIGTQKAANAAADGYTLLMMSSTFLTTPHLSRNVPYDALRDFTPVGLLTRSAFVLISSPATNCTSISRPERFPKTVPQRA